MPSFKSLLTTFALAASIASAHPGHDIAHEAAERREFLSSVKRSSLAHCASKLRARGVEARNIARRSAQVNKARQKRSLKKRDADTVLNTSHNKTSQGFSPCTAPSVLFASINSCVLTPEVTQGPYYVAGEYVRENIIEDQEGLNIVLDYQVIDVETCDPVPDVALQLHRRTWLRGIQKTDSDGVAQFESIFPGHYTSRATHIHVMVHTNATLLANQTLGRDNYASHVGQAFFDQDLISQVETLEPYASNTQELTLNADDGIMSEETNTDGVDPVMEYTLLGDSISDGLFAWLAFGINSTQSSSVSPAAYYYKEGGVANENSGGGMGGSPPSGAAPGGTPPAKIDE
ncbi:hypothetical protein H9Q74_004578 [Fusarium xylarioides]|nr:hypothetical protein H9Q71_003565 [Fusarium xylarioides]KAG5825308.1 hypothetical protein H9Q74_004578 [Fusarium xylarioides]